VQASGARETAADRGREAGGPWPLPTGYKYTQPGRPRAALPFSYSAPPPPAPFLNHSEALWRKKLQV
ncbi:unnamed protein product, partial [Urochloa humidicola]